jgi:hypothetical protein
LEEIQTRFFRGEETITFTKEEQDIYWPFLNNVYTPASVEYVHKNIRAISRPFWCRLHDTKPKTYTGKTNENENGPPAKKFSSTSKKCRAPVQCPKTMRQTIFDDGRVTYKPVNPKIQHNHDINEIHKTWRAKIFRDVAAEQVAGGYEPAAIYQSMSGGNGSRPDIELAVNRIGGSWFTRQDVINAAKSYRAQFPDPRRVGKDFLPSLQIQQALDFFASQSDDPTVPIMCHFKSLLVQRELDGEDSRGLVFASSAQLKVLSQRGCLVLMDATHNTNWLGWLLYTLLVRNECGSWLPVGHFLTEKSDGDIVCEALKTLKSWVWQTYRRDWPLRYFLTDDSAVEQKAVRNAFADLWPSHLLCTVHSERTLRRRFSSPKFRTCLDHLLTALKTRRTETGCLESIDAAIHDLHTRNEVGEAQYVIRFWRETRAMWAHFARDHSPLLLQVHFFPGRSC